MKNPLIKSAIFCGFGLFISTSFAAPIDPLIPSNSNNGNLSNVQIIGGYSSEYWTYKPGKDDASKQYLYMLTPSPSLGDISAVTFLQSQYQSILTDPKFANDYLSANQSLTTLITANAASTSNTLNALMAEPYPLDDSGESYGIAGGEVMKVKSSSSGILNLDLNSLIKPVMYTQSEKDAAKSFIDYVTNQYAPQPYINFSPFIKNYEQGGGDLAKALGNTQVQQYLYLIRQTAALQSVGISNLNFLYNQRVPQKTSSLLSGVPNASAIQAALPQNLQQDVSPLALEKWMATRRLSEPDSGSNSSNTQTWSQTIENASPATLQRETVYLLAEIQQQLYKQNQLQERLLATNTMQQLQSSGATLIKLQQLQRDICSQGIFKSTSGVCPLPQTPPTAASGGS